MITILVIILVLALFGALPTWPYSRGWGLLPERWPGAYCADTHHSVANGKSLAGRKSGLSRGPIRLISGGGFVEGPMPQQD